MIPSLPRFLTALGALFLLAGAAHAQTAIITKARAYLGPEAALNAVNSIHYTGKLVAIDANDPNKQTHANLDIICQKPERYRITNTSDKTVEIAALDGYEGWQRVQDRTDPSKWKQTLATVDQVKQLRANVWENVAFFRGIETRGGRLEVLESATVGGILCDKIAFIYTPKIVFYRYFDHNTGKLVQTETENGTVIKEEGEILVNGIRFPKSIVTAGKPGVKAPTVTITFEEIKLNETFADSLFAVPTLSRK